MRNAIIVGLLAIIAAMLCIQTACADEISDFRRKIGELNRQLLLTRETYRRANARFNELRDPLLRMDKSHQDYQKMVKEHNKLYEEMPNLHEAVNVARSAVQKEIISFLGKNSKEAMKTVFDIFYKGSREPDVSVERAVVAGLVRVSDPSALNFMIEQLKSSRSENLRKMLCQVFEQKKGDRAVEVLIGMLDDKDWELVGAAARALSRIGAKRGVESMISAFERAEDKREEGAMRGLLQALREMTGQYALETTADFRNWWNGGGRDGFGKNAPAGVQGAIGKDGPRSTLYGVITSKKVIFVCDVSHSMSARGLVPAEPTNGSGESGASPDTGKGVVPGSGDKGKSGLDKQGVRPGFEGMRIDILKLELAHVVLNMLPDDTKFNLVTYSGLVRPWKKSLTRATKSSRRAALEFVKEMEPLGMTNAYGALETAFTDKSVDTIYYLSDGYPTTGKYVQPEEILAAVRRWNQGRSVTIHTIGLIVGKYKNEEHGRLKTFVQKLAAQNGGDCRIFEDK